MERLTIKFNDGYLFNLPTDEKAQKEYVDKVSYKLGEYEDLEEQGLLLKLPCKVGGTVYQHMIIGVENKKPVYKTFEARVFKYSVDSITLSFWTETKDEEKLKNIIPISAFGKSVFLTKEEAEKALAEIEKKHE